MNQYDDILIRTAHDAYYALQSLDEQEAIRILDGFVTIEAGCVTHNLISKIKKSVSCKYSKILSEHLMCCKSSSSVIVIIHCRKIIMYKRI